MATYGGSERNFKLPQIKNDGAQFWTKTDSETKKTTVFRRYPGPLNIIALDKNVEIGTIENGKLADLIAFKVKSKDPLNSIINASNKDIKLKMINGEII